MSARVFFSLLVLGFIYSLQTCMAVPLTLGNGTSTGKIFYWQDSEFFFSIFVPAQGSVQANVRPGTYYYEIDEESSGSVLHYEDERTLVDGRQYFLTYGEGGFWGGHTEAILSGGGGEPLNTEDDVQAIAAGLGFGAFILICRAGIRHIKRIPDDVPV
jgi:hypothetical protein